MEATGKTATSRKVATMHAQQYISGEAPYQDSLERQCWFLAEILYTLQQLLLACQLLDSLMFWDNIYYSIIFF